MAQSRNSSKKSKKTSKRNRKRFGIKIRNKNLLINNLIMLASFVIIFLMMNNASFYGIYNYVPGDMIKEDIYLKNDLIDYEATNELKNQKASEVEPIMYVDFSKQVESKKNLTEFFSRLLEIKSDYGNDIELMKKVYAGIERRNAYNLDDAELMSLVVLSNEKLSLIQNYTVDITVENMSNGLTASEITTATQSIEAYIASQSDINDFEKSILLKLISGSIVENKFVDEAKTQAKVDAELAKIDDVTYNKGTLYLAKGNTLSQSDYELLKSGGIILDSTLDSLIMKLGLVVLLGLLWFILHIYLWYFEIDIIKSNRKYGILMSLFLNTSN